MFFSGFGTRHENFLKILVFVRHNPGTEKAYTISLSTKHDSARQKIFSFVGLIYSIFKFLLFHNCGIASANGLDFITALDFLAKSECVTCR